MTAGAEARWTAFEAECYLQPVGSDAAPDLPALLGASDHLTWDGPFVRAATLLAKDRERINELKLLLADPRMHALTELTLTFRSRSGAAAIARLAKRLPPALRSLRLGEPNATYVEDMSGAHILDAAALLAADLPDLEILALHGPLTAGGKTRSPTTVGKTYALAHPRLRTLVLDDLGAATPAVHTLRRESLPSLRELVVTSRLPPMVSIDSLCHFIAESGLLGQLVELTLTGVCTGAGVELLAKSLGDHRIPRLELRSPSLSSAIRAQFAALCDELVAPDDSGIPREEWVAHTMKPEWGRGRVVRRFDDKIEIQFAAGGTKIFPATSPLLRPL